MARTVLLAVEALPSPRDLDAVAALPSAPVEWYVVVPLRAGRDSVHAVVGGLALERGLADRGAVHRDWRDPVEAARGDAERVLTATVQGLHARGLSADGETTDHDPLWRIGELVYERSAAGLVVLGPRRPVRERLRRDLVWRVRRGLGLPARHLVQR